MKLLFISTLALVSLASLSAEPGGDVANQTQTKVEETNARVWTDRLEYVGIAVEEENHHVWCTSPIFGPDGDVHLFVSRWPISTGFDGWMIDCEIARYVGERPEGPFVFKEVVVKGSGKGTWDHQAPHNPNIKKAGDKYVLTYIANAGGPKKSRVASQRIGMLVADHPAGPWKKVTKDGMILSPPDDPGVWSHNSVVGVNNPAFFPHPDGRYFLYYKAQKQGDVRRMGVAISNRIEGPYVFHKDSLTSNKSEIEDGYAFYEDNQVNLITTHNSDGSGYLWKSKDGITFGEPIIGYEKMPAYISNEKLARAKVLRGKKFERPQVLLKDGKPSYLYVASGANWNGGKGSCSCVLKINPPR